MVYKQHNSDRELFFSEILAAAFNKTVEIHNMHTMSGGCINHATGLKTSEGHFFLKWNANIPPDMFEKEALGLKLLAGAGSVRTPVVLSSGIFEGRHYLLMEYMHGDLKSGNYWEDFGRSLAEMHRDNTEKRYGLEYDNYIGRLHQYNAWGTDWPSFFAERRLEVQLQMALKNNQVDGRFADRYRGFYKLLPGLLPEEPPSLLHGDLWSGNVMTGNDGKACFMDPAVYYGNREIEMAFTRMFGGFDQAFYDTYQEAWPLAPGFDQRADIYNMYPSMVHVNLFGSSYLGGVERVLSRYC